MPFAAWVGLLHTLWVAAPPAASVCHVDNEGHASARLTLTTPWDGWPTLCEALGDYLDLPPPPLATKHTVASVQALKALGYFSDVTCAAGKGDVADANTLVCHLDPGPIVHSFDLGGDVPFALLKNDVRRRVFLRVGTLLTHGEEQAKRQSERLEAYMEDEGYFGTEVEVTFAPAPGVEPNEGIHVQINLHPGRAANLRKVRIAGYPNIPQDDVVSTFRHWWFLYVPERFRPSQFLEDLRSATDLLQEKGWPAAHVSGKYTLDKDAHAVDIDLEIKPGPKVALVFLGNHAISNGALEDLAGFRAAGAVDTVAIEEMRAQIVTAFQRKGYYLATVASEVKQGDDNVWTITFTIHEGPKTHIGHVVFTGNASFSANGIEDGTDLLTQGSSCWFNRPWVDTWVTHDVDNVVAFYHAHGFPDVRISASPRATDANTLDVVFSIDEGRHLVATAVNVSGLPSDFPLRKAPDLDLQVGSPLVDATLEHDSQALAVALTGRGYMQATVIPHIADGNVTYEVTPGTQVHAGGLFLRGNFDTRSSVLRREVPVQPGDVLDLPALGAARRNLRALNVFNTVDLKPLTVYPETPVTWMLLEMEERDVRTLDAVAAVSSDDWFQIGADFSDRNLWGRANSLDIQVRFADASDWIPDVRLGNEDRATASLHVARPFGLPFDNDGALLYDYQDLLLYRTRRFGGNASISKTLLAATHCSFCPTIVGKLGYELVETYFVFKDLANTNAAQEAADTSYLNSIKIPNQTISRFIPSLSVDKRDSPIDPHEGYRWDGRIDIAHPDLAGPLQHDASPFWRVISSVQGYLTLGTPLTRRVDENRRVGGPLVAALSLQYNAAGPWATNGRVPISETFAYGGDFSVRGLIANASNVAIVGAHYMVVGSFELRWYAIPDLGFGSVQIAAFTDLGSVSQSLHDLLHTNTVTVGPALRYVTPVGPLSLAYGIGVVRPLAIVGPRPDVIPIHGRFHFTFGYSF